ncbi:MAG: S-adenosylmethionine:tRNA ribosyltransferase-isomerase [Bacteroidales bacterium]|jgi:S-adenosylmethionine:tRNA ribosyltransferase-isomerase|nr:S-adenosylmethionine:tRNA ribosyltransferase-isomerase [Bacteroidales bacterium]
MQLQTLIADFDYPLPQNRIADFPLAQRDESKLLIFKDKQIKEDIFKNIDNYLNINNLLLLNDTSVVPARLLFTKSTGATIEILCLSPQENNVSYLQSLQQKGSCVWKCYIGNNKRMNEILKMPLLIDAQKIMLTAERLENIGDSFLVRFQWQPTDITFAQILDYAGNTPLPPYIKRKANEEDKIRYQTVFAKQKGSVAAPTAGLHFTQNLLKKIAKKGIFIDYLTLHVGAGTFKPVTTTYAEEHQMHAEKVIFSKISIEHIYNQLQKSVIAVGTTTTRSLESLYWCGVKLKKEPQLFDIQTHPNLSLSQWEVYQNLYTENISVKESFENILKYMNINQLQYFPFATSLMILPFYTPKVVKGLITNFHQPQSTLLLLIASFVGQKWKEIYNYALAHDFRFLSYGDVCLFM